MKRNRVMQLQIETELQIEKSQCHRNRPDHIGYWFVFVVDIMENSAFEVEIWLDQVVFAGMPLLSGLLCGNICWHLSDTQPERKKEH